ncbi:MAG: hypothetical protein K1X74_07275 [Pirellulales bacterium]|nr:hypothetical protein [Pirellulales bacterium]
MQANSLYDTYEADSTSAETGIYDRARKGEAVPRRSRRISYSRSGGRPSVHSGIHRRRNKRWTW